MVSVAPDAPGFGQALELATKALGDGEKVYLYCIDDAVPGIGDPRLAKLREDGLNLFGSALKAGYFRPAKRLRYLSTAGLPFT